MRESVIFVLKLVLLYSLGLVLVALIVLPGLTLVFALVRYLDQVLR